MNCDKYHEQLALLAGGEIGSDELLAIEAHLSVCTDCSRELNEYRDLRGILAGLRDGTVPEGTFERIAKVALPQSAHRRWVPAWLARAAAMLVVGLSLGYSTQSIIGRLNEKPAPASRVAREADPHTGATVVPGFAREATGMSPYSAVPVRSFELNFSTPPSRFAPTRRDATYYLPRVETILNPDEVHF